MTCSRLLMLAFSSLLLLTGCASDWGPPGPERTETRTIPMDQSEEVKVNLRMGAGEMTVSGGADDLMDGKFLYHRLRLRPEVSYDNSGFRSHLRIEEPGHAGGSNRYAWDLRLNNQKPLDLDVNFGAGECRLDLEDLALRRVSVNMGVGQLRMDLRGTPKHDYSVYVNGGVGEATVYLPNHVGVEANVQGGLGDIEAPGLHKRDRQRYVNDLFGRSETTVHLDIHGGIGAIHLISQ